jgi:hypothetical protein
MLWVVAAIMWLMGSLLLLAWLADEVAGSPTGDKAHPPVPVTLEPPKSASAPTMGAMPPPPHPHLLRATRAPARRSYSPADGRLPRGVVNAEAVAAVLGRLGGANGALSEFVRATGDNSDLERVVRRRSPDPAQVHPGRGAEARSGNTMRPHRR